ncbi:PSP1 C-terminal conserved region-domain-containing protein [Mycena polygramma]|nr:PSP1 C-terminal conserved region-domain-containing protein [Mycena polygramma]
MAIGFSLLVSFFRGHRAFSLAFLFGGSYEYAPADGELPSACPAFILFISLGRDFFPFGFFRPPPAKVIRSQPRLDVARLIWVEMQSATIPRLLLALCRHSTFNPTLLPLAHLLPLPLHQPTNMSLSLGFTHAHPGSFSGYRDSSHTHLDEPPSGSTSRRHSVSVVQPRRLAGFNVPDSPVSSTGGLGLGGGGGFGGGGGGGFASAARSGGGLLLSDDDLEIGLGLGGMHLGSPPSSSNNNNHHNNSAYGGGGGGGGGYSPAARRGGRDESLSRYGGGGCGEGRVKGEGAGAGEEPGSLPIHAPLGRSPSLGLSIGAGLAGGGSKDWADAYFSPPRESALGSGLPALNTNVGPGAGVARGAVSPTQGRYPGGQGQGQGYQQQYQQQPPYSPHTAHTPAQAFGQYGPGSGGGPAYASAHPSHHGPPSAHPSHHGGQGQGQGQGQVDLGKGLPLHAVPPEWPLYIVEFKAGRTDLFYRAADRMASQNGRQGNGNGYNRDEDADPIRVGDLVIVEADRGKDLGKVVNDSITLSEVEAFWAGQQRFGTGQSPPTSPGGPDGGAAKKEIAPKMIYGKAGAGDAQLLVAKMQDEVKALQLCQTKVRAKKLPMEVVDAEYQWDRRKLTFYFVAEKRIDFRELVRELFRLYKTRIWMASLQGAANFEQ